MVLLSPLHFSSVVGVYFVTVLRLNTFTPPLLSSHLLVLVEVEANTFLGTLSAGLFVVGSFALLALADFLKRSRESVT